MRVRLHFASGIRVDGDARRSWFEVPPGLKCMGDLHASVQQMFRLRKQCPAGLRITLDGFALPAAQPLTVLREGDVLPIELPEHIFGKVNGVPVVQCGFGTMNGQYALRVERMLNYQDSDSNKETDHD